MADTTDWNSLLSGLSNIYGAYTGAQNANDINSAVGGLLGNQATGYNEQLQNLQNQIGLGQSVTQGQYNAAKESADKANASLSGNVDYLTNQMQALTDPNSAYMQQARQAIERKDAAAGRRSQWGDREVQLAGTLADYVGKYTPAFQNAINAAQSGITANNTGLANIYNQMSASADRNNLALTALLNGMNGAATSQNTTARDAANSAAFNNAQAGRTAAKGLGSLLGGSKLNLNSLISSLFGGGSSGGDYGGIYSGSGLSSLGSSLGYDSGWGSSLGNVFNSGNGYLSGLSSLPSISDYGSNGYSGLGSLSSIVNGYDTGGLGSWYG